MNKFIKILWAILIVVICFLLLEQRIVTNKIVEKLDTNLSSVDLNRTTTIPSNTFATCGTTSSLVVATSTNRKSLEIVNDSANTIYLGEGTTAVGSNGIRLNAGGGSYSMDSNFVYTGPIYCIASSTSNVTVKESY